MTHPQIYTDVFYDGEYQDFKFIGMQGTEQNGFALYTSNLDNTLSENTIKTLLQIQKGLEGRIE